MSTILDALRRLEKESQSVDAKRIPVSMAAPGADRSVNPQRRGRLIIAGGDNLGGRNDGMDLWWILREYAKP